MPGMPDALWFMRRTVETGRLIEGHEESQVLALSRLADALDQSGEGDEALALSREAVPLIPRARPLIARMRPRKRREYAYDLVYALDELAEDQLALGRHDDAITAAELAIRGWSQARDTHWILGVGICLNLVSRGHAAEGRWDAALGAADEAVSILRANGGGPDLAEALTHRSAALAATGHPAEAQAVAEEAAEIRAAAT